MGGRRGSTPASPGGAFCGGFAAALLPCWESWRATTHEKKKCELGAISRKRVVGDLRHDGRRLHRAPRHPPPSATALPPGACAAARVATSTARARDSERDDEAAPSALLLPWSWMLLRRRRRRGLRRRPSARPHRRRAVRPPPAGNPPDDHRLSTHQRMSSSVSSTPCPVRALTMSRASASCRTREVGGALRCGRARRHRPLSTVLAGDGRHPARIMEP